MRRSSNPTAVNMLVTGVGALVATVIIYQFLLPLFQEYYAVQLLNIRGWVPYGIVYIALWSVFVLVVKVIKLRNQIQTMGQDLLPFSISVGIVIDNANDFSKHLISVAKNPENNFLIYRLDRALKHFLDRGNVRDVGEQLRTLAYIDANAVEASYTMLKTFIWAIPILGFIGTVMGIGQAVGSFSESVQSAQDLTLIINSLGAVTSGLAVSFDTTLLALVMSIIIMFPASALQTAEENYLDAVEFFCSENFLRRLKVTEEVSGPLMDEGVIQDSIAREMARHHASLEAWSKKMDIVGKGVTDHAVSSWQGAHQKIQQKKLIRQKGDQNNPLIKKKKALKAKKKRLKARLAATQTEQGHFTALLKNHQKAGAIKILPSGSTNKRAKPYFIESLGKGLIIHEGNMMGGVEKRFIEKERIAASSELKKFIKKIKNDDNGMALFLIRPDGVASYEAGLLVTKREEVRAGKVPLPGDGSVDIDAFFGLLK